METRITARPLPYVLFSFPLGSVGIIWIAGYLKTSNMFYLCAGTLCLILIGCIFLWLSHYRLDFSNDCITVGRFAGMKRALHLGEIAEWYTVDGLLDWQGRVGSLGRMVIEPTCSSRKKPLVIPLKFFAPEDVRLLKGFLPEDCKARPDV